MNIRLEAPRYAALAAGLGASPLIYANCGPLMDSTIGAFGSPDKRVAARAVAGALARSERPLLHVGWCDPFFCTPRVGDGENAIHTGVTIADLAKGLAAGRYVADKAIAAFAPFAEAIRAGGAGLEERIEGYYFDVEDGPAFDNLRNAEFGGDDPNGLYAMLGRPSDRLAFARQAFTASYNACRMVLAAHGLNGNKAIVLGCTKGGQHNDGGVMDIPAVDGVVRSCLDFTRGTEAQLGMMEAEIAANDAEMCYVILNTRVGAGVLRRQLAICEQMGVGDVTIFPESPAVASGDSEQVVERKNREWVAGMGRVVAAAVEG